ncbi:MAG: T9SS type A sorting domain-containing protein [Flavobacteriaceae bacterium]
MRGGYFRMHIPLLLFYFLANVSIAQELHVGSGGIVSVTAGDALYVKNNLSIDASGSLTVKSDATSSASLLVSGTSTGDITYVRNISNTAWHLVSAPVTSQNIPTFVADGDNGVNFNSGNGNYAVSYYKNTNDAGTRWTYHNTSPSAQNQETLTSFINGQGYSMNRTSAGDFSFKGGLQVSDVNLTLSTSGTGHFWYCVGNPYPSFLPANNAANGSNNILASNLSVLDSEHAALYYWDGGGGPEGGYKLINNATGAAHFHPGQAFMVRLKSNNESFSFISSIQSHQTGTANFYRTTNSIPSIVVSLSNGNQNSTTKIKYISGTTAGLDVGYDAGTYQDGVPTFSLDTHLISDSQGTDFMLQCLPDNDYESLVIPLAVRASANAELVFSATSTNLPSGTDVYLHDTEENVFVKISEETYQITLSQELQGVGRFYLHTSQSALSVGDETLHNDMRIFKTSNENIRITGLEDLTALSVTMYSVNGKMLMTKSYHASSQQQDVVLPRGLAKGVYLIRVASENGTYNKKIIIE